MTHKFNIDIAKDVGVNAAILYDNIQWWCIKNRANDKNFYDGEYWTYNSVKAWAELLPYLGKKQIENALKKLEEFGYIGVGNHNSSAYDRTKWYCDLRKIDLPVSGNENNRKGNTIPSNKPANKPAKEKIPTLKEIKVYAKAKALQVSAEAFYEYFEAGNWTDSNGNKVKNWKQKMLTWNNHQNQSNSPAKKKEVNCETL